MSDGADRRRRGRKLPIAPEPGGPASSNGLNGPNGLSDDGEAPPEGEAEARPIEPEATEGSPPAAEAEPSAAAVTTALRP